MSPVRLVLFICVALAVYGGMHYYVYRNLLVVASKIAWFKWAFLAMSLSFPVVMFLGHGSPMCPGKWPTRLASLWLGVVFQLFVWFLVARIVRWLWARVPGLPEVRHDVVVWVVVACVLVLSTYGFIRVLAGPTTVKYTVDRASKYGVGNKVRIVQLSDVHLGTSLGEDFLAGLVERVHALEPDLLLVTGDLVDLDVRNFSGMMPLLSRLEARMGVYAVTGNHEYISGVDGFLDVMKSAGIPVLQNRLITIDGAVQLAGINDREAARMTGESIGGNLEVALADRDPSLPCILMAHQPAGLDHAVEKEVDLVLSGHTHAGQVFPFQVFVRLAFKHISGQHRIGPSTDLVVSNGTGFWGPPIRTFAPAQIVVVELEY
jgi:predicted MPP superfamily phosphohydrolase